MISFLQYVLDGVAVGSLYVLLALGFTLIFGVMGFMNVAHADLYMIAVFVFLWVAADAGFGVPAGAVAGVLAATALGIAIYYLVLKRITKDRVLALFVATLGVSYILENVVAKAVDHRTRSVPALFTTQYHTVAGIRFSNAQAVLLVVTVGIAAALLAWLARSQTGRLMRAVAENRELAEIVAIDTGRVALIAVGVASLIAGVGALLVANTSLAIDPFVANTVSLKMFAVAVVAGVGSVGGAVVVGFLLGVVESVTVGFFGSEWQNVIGLAAMAAVLLLRPQGLFGRTARVG